MPEQQDVDDGELLEAWAGGDQAAGATLFERHYPSIARFFRNKVKATAQADLIQETFLRALKGVVGFHRQASFRAFLFGIAHHVLADFLRQLAIGGARHDAEIEIDQLPAVSYDPTPVASVTMREEQRLLLEALRRIPMKHQIVLELHYWEYLTAAQISTVLGVPLGTVKTRLRDGHKILQRQLKELARSPEVLRTTPGGLVQWARRVRVDMGRQLLADAGGVAAHDYAAVTEGFSFPSAVPIQTSEPTLTMEPLLSGTIRGIVEADWQEPGPVLRVIKSLTRSATAQSHEVSLDDIKQISRVSDLREALRIAEYLASERIGLLIAHFKIVQSGRLDALPDRAVYVALRTGILRDPQSDEIIEDWPKRVILAYLTSAKSHHRGT